AKLNHSPLHAGLRKYLSAKRGLIAVRFADVKMSLRLSLWTLDGSPFIDRGATQALNYLLRPRTEKHGLKFGSLETCPRLAHRLGGRRSSDWVLVLYLRRPVMLRFRAYLVARGPRCGSSSLRSSTAADGAIRRGRATGTRRERPSSACARRPGQGPLP